MIGREIVRLAEASSTNDVAARLAADGAPEGTVVVAGRQLSGRGRQGRPWHSPPGANLYFSIVLRPERPLREWPELSWALAAAVAVACRDAGAAGVALKHPNDVVVDGRKLAGILLETRTGPEPRAALIAGVGLNVNLDPATLPDDLRGRATSLARLTGRAHDPEAVLAAACARLEQWYAAWSSGGAAAALRLREAEGLPAAGGDAGAGALEEAAAPAGREA